MGAKQRILVQFQHMKLKKPSKLNRLIQWTSWINTLLAGDDHLHFKPIKVLNYNHEDEVWCYQHWNSEKSIPF